MPLTEKGEKIHAAMTEKYGEEKSEEVFYASKNKGTITGVDQGAPGMAGGIPQAPAGNAAAPVVPGNASASGMEEPVGSTSPITGDGHKVVASVRDLAKAAGAR